MKTGIQKLATAIRKHCMDCCYQSEHEVRECRIEGCQLHAFRLGIKREVITAIVKEMKDGTNTISK